MSDLREDWSLHSPEWAYNQPGWTPNCIRCSKRRRDCKKFNSKEYGSFAGEWICPDCVKETDYYTPAQEVLSSWRRSK